jgi:hypothetical protein
VTTYSITTSVAKIFDSPTGKKWLLYNTGTATAYASKFPTASFGEGFPLAPAGSLHWHEKDPLYLYTITGNTTVVVSDAVLDVFDANNLAAQIASALTGGSLLTNTGIATAIYNQGVPAAGLATSTTYNDVMAIGASGPAHDIDLGDAIGFQLSVNVFPGTVSTTDATACALTLEWFSDAARTLPVGSTTYPFLQQGNPSKYHLIRGTRLTPYARLTHSNQYGGTYAVTMATEFTLSHTALKPLIFRASSGFLADGTGFAQDLGDDSGAVVISGALPAGLTGSLYCAGKTGLAYLSVATTTAMPAGVMLRVHWADIDGVSNPRIITEVIPGGSAVWTVPAPKPFFIPNTPGRIVVENTAAVPITARISVTWDASDMQ